MLLGANTNVLPVVNALGTHEVRTMFESRLINGGRNLKSKSKKSKKIKNKKRRTFKKVKNKK